MDIDLDYSKSRFDSNNIGSASLDFLHANIIPAPRQYNTVVAKLVHRVVVSMIYS